MRSRRSVWIVSLQVFLDSPILTGSLSFTLVDSRQSRAALSFTQALRKAWLLTNANYFVLLHSRVFRSEGSRIMPADAELSSLLSRRQRINDELEEGKEVKKQYKFVNVYTEFHELSRREIKQYEQTFNRWVFSYSSLLFFYLFVIKSIKI